MRIPKRFTYKGKRWRVIIEKNLKADDGEEVDGLCDFDKRIIYLDGTLKRRKLFETFYHELGHVVVFEAHINPGVRFSEGIEEVLCDAFADLLITNFSHLKWKKR
jgi:Zn-dependent peptidase ImmA (M78 family)